MTINQILNTSNTNAVIFEHDNKHVICRLIMNNVGELLQMMNPVYINIYNSTFSRITRLFCFLSRYYVCIYVNRMIRQSFLSPRTKDKNAHKYISLYHCNKIIILIKRSNIKQKKTRNR
jgi:hypothetical protein